MKVRCPRAIGGADAAKYLQLPRLKGRVLDLCARARERFPKVSATVLGAGSGDQDNSVIALQGPAESVKAAESVVEAGLMVLLADTRLQSLAYPDHEVQWLLRNIGSELGADLSAVIRLGKQDQFHIGDVKIVVAEKDFRNLSSFGCDAIVNPANSKLKHVGGLAKAIYDVTGDDLGIACAIALSGLPGQSLNVGEAFTTGAFKLSSLFQHIIHVVAPNLTSGTPTDVQRETLRRCIHGALNECVKVRAECVAIPGVGAGIFQWSCHDSAFEITRAIGEWVLAPCRQNSGNLSLRSIVLFDSNHDMVDAFDSALKNFREVENGTAIDCTTLAKKSAAESGPDIETIPPPGPQPVMPEYRWYWQPHQHELDSKNPIYQYSYKHACKQFYVGQLLTMVP